jgi:hypothetical protein
MLDTVFAAKMCDYGMLFCMRELQKKTNSDLDRLETVRACLFSLLPEDNERTTILQNDKISKKIVVRCQKGYLIGGIYGLMFSHLVSLYSTRSSTYEALGLGLDEEDA